METFNENSINRSLVRQVRQQQETIASLKTFILGITTEHCMLCPDKDLCDKCGMQLRLELLGIR